MTSPSDLLNLLVLEEAIDTPDGGGGFTTSWQPVATAPQVFAKIDFGSGGEELLQRQVTALTPCRITLRRRDEVTPQHRLRDDSYVYEILSVVAEAGYMQLNCQRRIAD